MRSAFYDFKNWGAITPDANLPPFFLPFFLEDNGIIVRWLNPAGYTNLLEKYKKAGGYVHQDIVQLADTGFYLSPTDYVEKTVELDAILKKFKREHRHTEDEVRFVLAGCGAFYIRTLDDAVVRIEVTEGDYISIPANRYHWFELEEKTYYSEHCAKYVSFIRTVRLFKDQNGWEPIYKEI